MKIEVDPNCEDQSLRVFDSSGEFIFTVTPQSKGGRRWLFRVKLKYDQAILGFPKMGTIGIGFAKEEDWDFNVPCEESVDVIFDNIKSNKRYSDISEREVREAIQMVKAVAQRYLEERPHREDEEEDGCE